LAVGASAAAGRTAGAHSIDTKSLLWINTLNIQWKSWIPAIFVGAWPTMNSHTIPAPKLIVIIAAHSWSIIRPRAICVVLAGETGAATIPALHTRPNIRAFVVPGAIDSAGVFRATIVFTTASIGAVIVSCTEDWIAGAGIFIAEFTKGTCSFVKAMTFFVFAGAAGYEGKRQQNQRVNCTDPRHKQLR
jgi:hypothetical protein